MSIRDLAGDGDHYAAEVVAESFRGKTRVQQHQMVYDALKGNMGGVLHALQLQTQRCGERPLRMLLTPPRAALRLPREIGRDGAVVLRSALEYAHGEVALWGGNVDDSFHAAERVIAVGQRVDTPTAAAARAPIRNWPCAPMLNRPARKARPTPSPARIRVRTARWSAGRAPASSPSCRRT